MEKKDYVGYYVATRVKNGEPQLRHGCGRIRAVSMAEATGLMFMAACRLMPGWDIHVNATALDDLVPFDDPQTVRLA